MQHKRLIVIQGPTASGKTALAVALAQHLQTVVLSADSRQFYREMSIGTAKPDLEEQQGIQHYFIDSHTVSEPLSAANYAREAREILQREFQQHDEIVLVGGSGMFIDALCKGLDDIPHDTALRDALTHEVQQNGIEKLVQELQEKDPVYYNQVDRQNPARIIRAIEAIRLSGKTYTELRKQKGVENGFESIAFVIDLPRQVLYERINMRVDVMLQNGLLAEVQKLEAHKDLSALRTVGYTEMFRYLDGELDLQTATELIKQNTRRYAKRQLTWFRRDEAANWLKATELESQKKEILQILQIP